MVNTSVASTSQNVGQLLLWAISNSSGDAHMRQDTRSSLVQILACRMYGVKPLSELTLFFVDWNLRGNTDNIESKYKKCVPKIVFGCAVCKITTLLVTPQSVNTKENYWILLYSYINIISTTCIGRWYQCCHYYSRPSTSYWGILYLQSRHITSPSVSAMCQYWS